jgi:hypothetical protein
MGCGSSTAKEIPQQRKSTSNETVDAKKKGSTSSVKSTDSSSVKTVEPEAIPRRSIGVIPSTDTDSNSTHTTGNITINESETKVQISKLNPYLIELAHCGKTIVEYYVVIL